MENKINILEFNVGELLFGLRTEYIKNIFDIENIKKAPLMPDYVAGITTHGKHIYPLICTEKLLELSDSCEQLTGKTAIAVEIDGNTYALAVDEIRKIQEIEKTGSEDDVINFYNLKGEVLEEITPKFLKAKIKLPPFRQELLTGLIEEEKEKRKEDEEGFLVFKLEDKLFALKTDFVKKVEYIENLKKTITADDSWIEGVFLVKNTPVKTGNLKRLFSLGEETGEYLIILEKDGMLFGLTADDIIDIVSIKKTQINTGTDRKSILPDFFVYSKEIIPVLSDSFIEETLREHSLKVVYTEEKQTRQTKQVEILLFKIGDEKLGIKMENVDEVKEYKEVHISNYPTEVKAVKGLIATNRESMFLISYEEFLNQKIDTDSEDTKIMIIKEGELKIALLISDIEDILVVPEENLALIEDKKSFLEGTVMGKNGELINIINPAWALYTFSEKRLTEG
ncbi:chemotaxis protein CheW [Persephonella sp.]